MKRNTKLNRIKNLLKKYPETSSYLLNIYSRKVYTHADLDIIEELLNEGFFEAQLKGFSSGEVQFENSDGVTLVGEFVNLNRRPNQWNGLYHFSAIRRSLAQLKLSQYHIFGFNGKFQFWNNPEYNYIIDVEKRQINWWPVNGSAVDLNNFKNTIEDVMSSIMFRNNKDEFTYKLIENPNELLLGMDVVSTSDIIKDPYLQWGPETMTLEEEKVEVAGEPATIINLKRGDKYISLGIVEDDGLHIHHPYDNKDAIAELWHRKGYDNIIWDEEVQEIIVEDEVYEAC